MAGGETSSTPGTGVAPATGPVSGPQALTRRPSTRSAAMATFSMEVFDNEVVPSSLGSIAPILRVASEIEAERPRIAYLCRFYAFEKAHRLDPSSSGRGVRQFKTSLLQRLERSTFQDNTPSLAKRVKKSDAREIESFYQQYYENYVRALDQGEQADRLLLPPKMSKKRRKFMSLITSFPWTLLVLHYMAYELHGLLAGNVSVVTGENIRPSYGGDDEAFLKKVISPIYHVIDKG
ncbi:hypothetical protein BHE74_00008853 [Ensete ventricosum]|nr:hypothetical protein BHE74_00008853 [Ensete ventricosum]